MLWNFKLSKTLIIIVNEWRAFVMIFHQSNQNSTLVNTRSLQCYPERPQSCHTIFLDLSRNLIEYRSFSKLHNIYGLDKKYLAFLVFLQWHAIFPLLTLINNNWSVWQFKISYLPFLTLNSILCQLKHNIKNMSTLHMIETRRTNSF